MTVFGRIANSFRALRLNFSLSDLDALMDQAMDGRPSYSGVDVSGDTATNFSAVFNAVAIIAGTIASLPFILYKRKGEDGKERLPSHPLYEVLHNLPNPEMTSFVFREMLMGHLLLYGNAYAEIIRDAAGRVAQLWPWDPIKTEVKRGNDRRIYYLLNTGAGEPEVRRAEQMLHIPGLGFDGRLGYSVIKKAREAMGLGLAMEEFQGRFYGQGTNVGTVLKHPGKLGDKAFERLQKDIKEKHGGMPGAHGTMILEEGMDLVRLGMPLEDAQFLESRVFQIGEVARWFNLPPHKLKELSRATFSNIEQQQIEFAQDTILPWCVRWEQHVWWKCLREDERRTLFAEFLLDGIQRGDTKSRMEAYKMMREVGAINADEIRSRENMNPIGGRAGKLYWMPMNMNDAAKEPEPAAPPPQEPAPTNGKQKNALEILQP